MKIQLITKFKMQWLDGFQQIFKDHEYEYVETPYDSGADIYLFMWCDAGAINFINHSPKKGKYIVWVRRYEMYTDYINMMPWDRVDEIIVVNKYLGDQLQKIIGRKPTVLYNGLSLDKWTYRKREAGKKIAWVGYVNRKKNFPMALQIMSKLPKDYELHVAGNVQNFDIFDYFNVMIPNLNINVEFHSHVDDMDSWLEDKDYLLSTATSEGNPNNVIEAMAKGIKPVVHNWPGAKYQFYDNHRFNTVDEAVGIIITEEYNSAFYREQVRMMFGEGQFKVAKYFAEVTAGEIPKRIHTLDGEALHPSKGFKIVSYPRSGRTWIKMMLLDALVVSHDDVPLIHEQYISSINDKFDPLFFTHSSLTWDKNDKLIFMLRDPRDVLVSSYFFCKDVLKKIGEGVTLSSFIRSSYGGVECLKDVYNTWYKQVDGEKHGVIYYENFVASDYHCEVELKSLCEMVGIDIGDKTAKKIVHGNRIENIKNLSDEKKLVTNIADKVRRGVAGGYVDYLSEEDIGYLDKHIKDFPKKWFGRYYE